MKLVYFSYPYSDNPEKRSEEVKNFVTTVLARHTDIVPIIPHLAFDGLFNFPQGYTHLEVLLMELEIISRCDFVVYSPDHVSSGVAWEIAFAKWLGKPVLTFQDVLTNGVKG